MIFRTCCCIVSMYLTLSKVFSEFLICQKSGTEVLWVLMYTSVSDKCGLLLSHLEKWCSLKKISAVSNAKKPVLLFQVI